MSKIKAFSERIKGKFCRLKTQLYLGYGATFAGITILIILFLFLSMRAFMMDQIGKSRLDVLMQISERSNTIKNSTITISNLYQYDENVRWYLTEKPEAVKNQPEAQYLDELKENYDKVFHDVGLAYDVVILGENGFRYSSRGQASYDFEGLKSQLWYRQNYDAENDITFISSFLEKFDPANEENQYVFSALRKVKNEAGEELGTILVNVDEKYLEELYCSAERNSALYIFDKKGNIVSSRNKALLGKNFIGVKNFRELYGENQYHIIKKLGQDYLLTNYYDPQTGWTIVEEMPAYVIFEPFKPMLVILAAVLMLCLLAGAGAACYLSEKISGPILKLCQKMDQVRMGDFTVISSIRGYEEVNQLKDSFNEMAAEIKKLLESVKQKEIRKRKSEMDFLRAQINPHFMYNTLFSIQCMTELGKNDQAVHMMSAFIDLLKRTLSVDTDLIPLKEEFESTEKYLVLQKIRYVDQILFELELDPGAGNCLVPALLIQPIVENAIFHGIEARKGAGFLVVEASVIEEELVITVSDDGAGFGQEELKELGRQLQEKELKPGKSIGIFNVQNRIKINFGDEYGLIVDSEEGIGTTVTMRLPVRKVM